MKSLILIILLYIGVYAQDNIKKVVFELTSGNVEAFEKKET